MQIPEQLLPTATNGNASVTDGVGKSAKVEPAPAAAAAGVGAASSQSATPSKNNNELICLDESDVGGVGNKLDGFSLDDINDDDFNPRANSEESEEEEERPPQSAPPQQQTFSPLPPPALPPRVATNNSQNNNLTATPPQQQTFTKDIFSANPFGGGGVDPFGMSAFQTPSSGEQKAADSGRSPFAPSPAAAAAGGHNFFDDLDPLRK